MPTLLLAVLVAAAPVQVHKLAAPGLSCVNLDEKLTQSLMLHFSQQLYLHGGFHVTSPQEISSVLGVERQKALLGCSEDQASCVAEIANALGVDAVILGTISKVGSGFLANIKIVSAKDASPLGVYSGRPRSEDDLLNFLEASAADFSSRHGGLAGAAPPVASPAALLPPPAQVEVRGGGSRTLAWVSAGAAVAGLAAGVTLVALAHGTESDLRTGKGATTLDQLNALANRGRTQETAGYALAGVGVAAAAASAVLFLLPTDKPSVALFPAVIPSEGGAVLTWGGRW